MKKRISRQLTLALCLLTAFVLWTIALCCIDVKPIGLNASPVGLATLNLLFQQITGVHWWMYILTDWLSLIPMLCAFGFALLGLVQWGLRKHLLKVDRNLLLLGGFYIVVMAVFVFFETVVINYRPVWIEGTAEASYPSSTTLLVLCIMPTTALQLKVRIKTTYIRRCVVVTILAFTALMVIGRLISGVHWLSDIIGGVLLSVGLVMLYAALCNRYTT